MTYCDYRQIKCMHALISLQRREKSDVYVHLYSGKHSNTLIVITTVSLKQESNLSVSSCIIYKTNISYIIPKQI